MKDRRAYQTRTRGERRLTAITAGVAAASVVGVGAVVAYDAHLFTVPLASGSTSPSVGGESGESGDDGGATQQQQTTTVPAATQQAPQATSGGS